MFHKDLKNRRSSDNKLYAECKQNNLIEIAELKANKLACQLMSSQQNERERVSNELHDGIGQVLTALKFQVGTIVNEVKETSQQRKNDTVLMDVLDNVKVALSDLKHISLDLQTPIIDELGLIKSLEWFVSKYQNIYTDIEVEIQLDVYESEISDDRKNILYRIVQEAMNNIAKHAHAKNVYLQLTSSSEGLLLRVSDDGCGFDVNDKKENYNAGLGLKSLENRAVKSGAKFKIISNSYSGTIIQVFWKK